MHSVHVNRKLAPGFLGPIISFAGIGAAIYIHRDWWRVTQNAISDLGAVGVPHNYVLNLSLITGGILAMVGAIFLLREMNGRITKTGTEIFVISLAFLTMIGLFPEKTPPHGFVSHMFFYLGIIGLQVAGCGGYWEGEFSKGASAAMVLITMLGASAAVVALAIFPGIAVAEFIGAGTIIGAYFIALVEKSR